MAQKNPIENSPQNSPKKKPDNKNTIKDLENKLLLKKDFAWAMWDDGKKNKAYKFSEDYIFFIDNFKTERDRVRYIRQLAEERGFKFVKLGENISSSRVQKLKPGDKVYYINRNKNIALIVIGKKPLTERVNLIGAHADTPRLDLKIHPILENEKAGMVFFKTHYYGGIKKYQYVAIPLYLTGTVYKKDGSKIDIKIGWDKNDPVFTIPDLLIHLSRTIQGNRTMSEVIKGEELNALAGATPFNYKNNDKSNNNNNADADNNNKRKDSKEKKTQPKFKLNLLKIIFDKYGINEDDLQSADLSLVPGIKAKYVGLDKSMIGGSGQDDGVCSYTAVRSILDLEEPPEYTSIVALFDKEETGSNGATGAQSSWLGFVLNDLISYTDLDEKMSVLNTIKSNILMLSADVGAAYNPIFPSAHDINNAAILGKGIILEKYGGARGKSSTNEAQPEFVAFLRNIFDQNKVPYQFGTLGAVDVGGGGTIAKFFAQAFNCDVIDAGTAVLGMHSPYEITHIADVYSTYLAYKTFLGSKGTLKR